MTEYSPELMPRTYFRAPRVPFDFRALALAIMGYLVWWGGGLLLSKIFGKEDLSGAFLASVTSLFKGIPYVGDEIHNVMRMVFRVDYGEATSGGYTFWESLVGGIWFFAVWTFFAQGIHRIVSLRLSRDEGLSLREALSFSWKNWATMLLVPATIVGVLAVFWLCNLLAGVITSIPLVGGILGIVLLPLVIVGTLLFLLICLGGILGLPLIGAAAAWECNGTLDAISRAFSYVFARPLQYFWNYFLIFMFTGVILLVGHWFAYTAVKTVDNGIWNDEYSVLIDAPAPRDAEGEDFKDLNKDAKTLQRDLESANGYVQPLRNPGSEMGRFNSKPSKPNAMHISAVGKAPWYHMLTALIWWVLLNLIWLGFFGYAVFWLLGATSCVYADLRSDVDGTQQDEIFLPYEEERFEELATTGPVTEGGAADSAPSGDPTPEASVTTETDAPEAGTTESVTPDTARESDVGDTNAEATQDDPGKSDTDSDDAPSESTP